MTTSPVEAHLRRHLGKPRWKWTRHDADFEVHGFPDQPSKSAVTLATVGLSRHRMGLPNGNLIRQELLLSCYEKYLPLMPADLMFLIGSDLVREHRGLGRGEVLGPAGPIVEGVRVEALLCMEPFYFDEIVGVVEGEESPIVLLALLPLSKAEAQIARERGWENVQDELVSKQPDLLDLDRGDFLSVPS